MSELKIKALRIELPEDVSYLTSPPRFCKYCGEKEGMLYPIGNGIWTIEKGFVWKVRVCLPCLTTRNPHIVTEEADRILIDFGRLRKQDL